MIPYALELRILCNTLYSDRQVLYGNIMYDRRIVRGNTYAQTYPTGVSIPSIHPVAIRNSLNCTVGV